MATLTAWLASSFMLLAVLTASVTGAPDLPDLSGSPGSVRPAVPLSVTRHVAAAATVDSSTPLDLDPLTQALRDSRAGFAIRHAQQELMSALQAMQADISSKLAKRGWVTPSIFGHVEVRTTSSAGLGGAQRLA